MGEKKAGKARKLGVVVRTAIRSHSLKEDDHQLAGGGINKKVGVAGESRKLVVRHCKP